MRRSVWAILAGLVLAVLGAAAVAKFFAMPLAAEKPGEVPIYHLLRTTLPVAAFALPGALTAILLLKHATSAGYHIGYLPGLCLRLWPI